MPFIYSRVLVNPSGNTALACSLAIPSPSAQSYASLHLSITCCCFRPQAICKTSSSTAIEFCLFFGSCKRASLKVNAFSMSCGFAYRWLNSWKANDLCLTIWWAISLVVLISRQALTISNGDQCLCLIKYLISLALVSVFI